MIQPRVFSFLSIPVFIIIPSLFASLKFLKEHKTDKNYSSVVFLIFCMYSYLLVYFLRSSQGRYLFSVTPLVMIFLVFFLKDLKKNKKTLIVLTVSTILAYSSIYFELNYQIIKTFFITMILGGFWALYCFGNYEKVKKTLFYGILSLIAFIQFALSAAAFYFLNDGQVKNCIF